MKTEKKTSETGAKTSRKQMTKTSGKQPENNVKQANLAAREKTDQTCHLSAKERWLPEKKE